MFRNVKMWRENGGNMAERWRKLPAINKISGGKMAIFLAG
jgi:hypothetical protein